MQNDLSNQNLTLKMVLLFVDGAVSLKTVSQTTGPWVEQAMFSEARVDPTFCPESKG